MKKNIINKILSLMLVSILLTNPLVAQVALAEELSSPTPEPESTETPESTPEVTPEPSPESSSTPEPTSTPEPEVIVLNTENDAEIVSEASSSANTGDNQSESLDSENVIITSTAQALANVVNFINLNIVGSSVAVDVNNFANGLAGDIDLNSAWQELIGQGGVNLGIDPETGNVYFIKSDNSVELINNVVASSNTGNNTSTSDGNSAIQTGNALSLANVVNFVNVNLLGSTFYFTVFNIFDGFQGDIILPRPENFVNPSSSSEGSITANNQAGVTNDVNANSNTGNNSSETNGGENTTQTGNAVSSANSINFVNTNAINVNLFLLLIQVLGMRTGQVLGWTSPDSVETSDANEYALNSGNQESPKDSNIINTSNTANVVNNVNASSNSGNNQSLSSNGNNYTQTGNAFSLANVFNLVNFNVTGGQWFFAIINILGDWHGNLIFAYPDVEVSLAGGEEEVSPGGTFNYSLTYKNEGYDQAHNVAVHFDLPEGMSMVGDNSGLPVNFTPGGQYSWSIGNLSPGQGGSFIVTVRVDDDFSMHEELSFWSRLIPEVEASDGKESRTVITTAQVATTDTESNTQNNTSSATVIISKNDEPSEDSGELPVLEIQARNNVNGYVYPGDTVTFEVLVTNKSNTTSHETKLVQSLYDGVPEDFGSSTINIGDLPAGKTATVRFGMKLGDASVFYESNYHTEAQAFAKSLKGDSVSSNVSKTYFEIRHKTSIYSTAISEVNASGQDVLGAEVGSFCSIPIKKENILPYVLVLVLSTLHITRWSRKRLSIVHVKKG